MIDKADAGKSVRIPGDDRLDVAVVEFSKMLGEHGTVDARLVHRGRDDFDGVVFAETTMGVRIDDHLVSPEMNSEPGDPRGFYLSGKGDLMASP